MLNKHSDTIPELTLPKWPFIIGDLCLIGIALAIAILGDWQLSNWQVVACVLSVALGAVLFVVPFVVEFQAREQEQSSVPLEQIAIVARHVKDLEVRATATANQLGRLEQKTASKTEQPTNSFETAVLQTLEDRIAEQGKDLKAAQVALEALRAQHTAHLAEPDPVLVARLEQLEAKSLDSSSAKISKTKAKPEAKKEVKSKVMVKTETETETETKTNVD